MNVQKAAYWLALGAFALALHNGYRQGDFSLVQRIQARTSSEFCRIAAHAEQTLAMARLLTTGVPNAELADDFTAPRQAEMEQTFVLHQERLNQRLNHRLARQQAEVNRAMSLRQVDLERAQQKIERVRLAMENARFENLRGLEHMSMNLSDPSDHHLVVVCRHTNAQVAVEADSDSADFAVPDVE